MSGCKVSAECSSCTPQYKTRGIEFRAQRPYDACGTAPLLCRTPPTVTPLLLWRIPSLYMYMCVCVCVLRFTSPICTGGPQTLKSRHCAARTET